MTVLPVIAGPTASGKTAAAVALAQRHSLEIISADSRQVYRHLDIGTAKPTPEERAAVRHHVIDVVEPGETYNAARFVADAESAIADILSRGKRPLVVGGTGLYIRALTAGMFEADARDEEVRAELQAWAESEGLSALHRELVQVDPDSAARIHPNDSVRILRALEVHRITGIPLSQHHRKARASGPRHEYEMAVLDPGREELTRRIEQRTRAMFDAGLIAETERVLASGVAENAPGLRAIGYPQAMAVLRGEMTRDEAIAQTTRATVQYAKRQRTWFRAERDAQWLEPKVNDEKFLEALAKSLAIT